MDAFKKLLLTVGAASASLALAAAPVAADVEDDAGEDPAAEETAEEGEEADAEEGEEADAEGGEANASDDHRVPIAETPRDRVGLIMLAALLGGGGLAAVNARRQMKGERPQATGEFRWR